MPIFKTDDESLAPTRTGPSLLCRSAFLASLPMLSFFGGCGLPGGTPPGAVVGRYERWDYSPSVIQTGNLRQFWWCGTARNPEKTSQDTDTIQYESIDLVTGQHIGPITALAETPGTWDAAYTCNPKVVQGHFSNPLGDGLTYTYALYYVATPNTSGSANAIGVAFSNDGSRWKKYPSPVIPTTNVNGYGAAQPVPYNSDGQQAITLFFEDDAPPLPADHHWEAVSTDGVHFTIKGLLTTKGLNLVPNPTWADMAYNVEDGYWYALFNLASRLPATTGNIFEHGQYGFQVYRIAHDDLLTGKTGWQELKTWDTNSLGFESVFLPALTRDGDGNLYHDGSSTIKIFPSFSNVKLSWNTDPASSAVSATTDKWDVGLISWSPADPTLLPLQRYWNGSVHRVTTGWIDAQVFTLEKTLGQVYMAPQAGATTPLWNCKASGVTAFVSLDGGCEAQYTLGLNGYIYAQPPVDVKVVPIYRCSLTGDSFVSSDPLCEGKHTDQLLGYIPAP